MVRLVLWDIDGTLIHTDGAGIKAFGRTLAHQFKVSDRTDHVRFSGGTDKGLTRRFFEEHGIAPTPGNFEIFFNCYVHWLDHYLHHSHRGVFPGVLRLIDELRKLPQPPTQGLLTGNIRLGAEIKLRSLGLWDHFELGGFGDDHEDRCKIAEAALKRGQELLGERLRGDQVVVIGDTPLDITCGRAIKAKCLAVATGGATLEELRAHEPDWLLENLESMTARKLCGLES